MVCVSCVCIGPYEQVWVNGELKGSLYSRLWLINTTTFDCTSLNPVPDSTPAPLSSSLTQLFALFFLRPRRRAARASFFNGPFRNFRLLLCACMFRFSFSCVPLQCKFHCSCQLWRQHRATHLVLHESNFDKIVANAQFFETCEGVCMLFGAWCVIFPFKAAIWFALCASFALCIHYAFSVTFYIFSSIFIVVLFEVCALKNLIIPESSHNNVSSTSGTP